ncbi:hypothetical protein IFM89_016322 [Coptis chinensis]|uniref:Protein kinase domain-containing protein n=1 Tax=Coptis chinensis TaxID=261450 RepID=A0A835HC51_9MAGN|nr:hypothetical protein IFM89_016322 [Coptis chinensis]
MDLHKKAFLFTSLCLLAFGEFDFLRVLTKAITKTKPHGHGDVHLLLYSSGLLCVWIEVGSLLLRYEWITLQVLASWFRLKYPHIALGAWASSAPVLFYLGDTKIYTELIEPSTTSTNDTMFQIPSASYSQKEYCEELDLKPENFLLVNRGEDSPLKATDFGVSVFIEEGSAYYVAPEVLGRSYGKDIDVWSAGTEKGIFEAILEGKIDIRSAPWPSISDAAKDLVKKMLTWDPKKWINAAQALDLKLHSYCINGDLHPGLTVPGIIANKRVGTLCQSDPIGPLLNTFAPLGIRSLECRRRQEPISSRLYMLSRASWSKILFI